LESAEVGLCDGYTTGDFTMLGMLLLLGLEVGYWKSMLWALQMQSKQIPNGFEWHGVPFSFGVGSGQVLFTLHFPAVMQSF